MILSCQWVAQALHENTLNLQPRPHKSRSRALWDDAPTLAEEKLKKQVWFDVEGDLGDDLTLPPGLTLFLAEGTAKEQEDAPSPYTPMDSPQVPPSEGFQHPQPIQEGSGLKTQPDHLLVNPCPNPNQGQRRNWIPLTTPIGGSMQRWWRLYTLTGGRN